MCDSKYIIYKVHEPIKGKKWTEEIPVSCGKCVECKQKRVNDWVFRLSVEAERSRSAFFVTLTYSNENLTKTKRNLSTLVKKDFQDYMKRLRKLNKGTHLKYYAVGEYGSKTKRPHYHLILFNAKPSTIEKAWKLNNKLIGHVHIGNVNKNSIAYTAKYIDKECFIGYSVNDNREKQFSTMSKRMGDNFLTSQMEKYIKTNLPLAVKKYGRNYSIPRYYIKKALTEEEQEQRRTQIEDVIQQKEDELYKKYQKTYKNSTIKPTFDSYKLERIRHRNQIFIKNLKSKRNVH